MRIVNQGERFGRYVIIEEMERLVIPSGKKFRRFLCQCDCGNTGTPTLSALIAGKSKSCGCLQIESVSSSGLTVGVDRDHDVFNVWKMMAQRCYNENHTAFKYYGEKGKSVCDRWMLRDGIGFSNFVSDMGPRPDGATLDRRDNDKAYSPENCRWVVGSVQSINRGLNANNTSGHTGVSFSNQQHKWIAQIALNYNCIYLGAYADWFDAVCARKSAEIKYFNPILEEAG